MEPAMILARVRDFRSFIPLHGRFARLADFLEQLDLSALPEGRMALEGEDIFVIASPNACTRSFIEAALEAHRTYIDVQVVLSGIDTMGWAPLAACTRITQPYDAERDIEFFSDPPLSLVPVTSGSLSVFFPEDAHAPLIGDGASVHKLVFKVRR
jgi:biofilm protein TabA